MVTVNVSVNVDAAIRLFDITRLKQLFLPHRWRSIERQTK